MTRTSSIIHKKKLYRNEGGMGQPKRMERERKRERESWVGTTKHLVFCGDYNALILF